MSGPLDSDYLFLLAQRPQECPDETSHVGDDVPQIGGNASSGCSRIGDRQSSQKASTHLHLVGWGFRDYPTDLCAVVEDFAEAGRYESGPGRYFRFSNSETQAPEVGYAVFVGIGEIIEVKKGVMDWQTPLRVRLQGLDECLWALSDVLDTPLPLVPEISSGSEDWEHGPVVLDSGVIEGELKNALVESGPQVVDDFSEQYRKVEGNGYVVPDVVDVLREVSLYRTANAVGAGLGVNVLRLKARQDFRLLIRSRDFESNRLNCRVIRFPNVD